MARLHQLGEWHGPGEAATAKHLEAELPNNWDIVAGRDIPDGVTTVDLDLIVVGERGIYVCEEKSWSGSIEVDEVNWFANGQRRRSPNSQVQHATRVLAGRLKAEISGWHAAVRTLPRGSNIVRGHVLLSSSNLVLCGEERLGKDVVLTVRDAPESLTRIDRQGNLLADPLRLEVMEYLLGLRNRRAPDSPSHIMQYKVIDKPIELENSTTYPAVNPAGELVSLSCVPVASAADPEKAQLLATREHDALLALTRMDRTWRVQGWFPWEGHIVTPIIVDITGSSLLTLEAKGLKQALPILRDAFAALKDVHNQGITHRALQPRSVEVSTSGRVRFRDFARAHLSTASTISQLLASDDSAASFRPSGLPLAMYQPADDVYALALTLTQWLRGLSHEQQPDHEMARSFVRRLPVGNDFLADCLSLEPAERPNPRSAAVALRDRP